MHISNQPNELNSTEIANDETTSAENHEYNGASPPHGTIPSLPQSPLTYASIATDEPLTRPLVEDGNDSQIAYMADHPKVHPKAANDAPLGHTKIGCTKILEIIWIAESKRTVSGKIGGKFLSVFEPNNTMLHLVN